MPESNGKVGILGISYDGFTAADGAGQSAPGAEGGRADEPDGRRLDGRRLVPQRRLPPAEHALHLRAGSHARQRRRSGGPVTSTTTTCSCDAGSAGELGARARARAGRLLEQASRASRPTTPSGRTGDGQDPRGPAAEGADHAGHSLWDQEDIYGALAVYKALKPKDTNNDKVFLVLGPWHHGQEIDDGSPLGALKFDSDTGALFPPATSCARSSTSI